MATWAALSNADRAEALRRFQQGESYADLQRRFAIDDAQAESFNRFLRQGRMWAEILQESDQVAAACELDLDAVADAIRNRPMTLRQLSRQFDRSEDTLAGAIGALKERDLHIVETTQGVVLDTRTAPTLPPTTLDLDSMVLTLAVASDLHCGSKAQQITNLIRFERYAVERGAQAILHTGDLFAGLNVYRGQINDLTVASADGQRRIAERMLAQYDGVKRLVLGGNHDFSFIKATGHDAVKTLCRGREDMTYLGYDVADVALTDRCSVRLWHPSGGVPYAVSYRLQKGMEQAAYEELSQAIEHDGAPNLRLVLSGHLHVECEVSRGPITGAQCGCFEGRTNYLKSKGLFPQVGGAIWRIWLTDGGLIQRKQYEFVQMSEIVDDWKHYPDWLDEETDEVETLYTWRADDE
jgi:hypothetical protein